MATMTLPGRPAQGHPGSRWPGAGYWWERRGRSLIQARMPMATSRHGKNRKCMVKLRTVRATMALRPRPLGIPQASRSGGPAGGGARRWAIAAASILFGAPSLRRMCETWTLTVLTLMTSVAAISRFV